MRCDVTGRKRALQARLTLAGVAILLAVSLETCRKSPVVRRLVIGHPAPLTTTSLHDPSHNNASFNILVNVYEALLERGPDLALRPLLAESWYSPDSLTWVFKLRRDVRRHDGRVLTADDVVKSVERSQQDAWTAGALAPVDRVFARGENEVVFTTKEPIDTLPARLVYVAVSGLPEPGGATGPYRIKSWTPGGSIVLEAFEHYHGGRPPIEIAEYRIVRDPRERAQRLIAGDLQFIEETSPLDMAPLSGARGVRAVSVPGFINAFLVFDTSRKETPYVKGRNPFADPRVREAINLAIDRRGLVEGPLSGHARATEQLAQPGQIGFEENRPPTRPDLARARGLLRAAGFPDGFEVPLDYMSGNVDPVAMALIAQLAQVSIRVTPRGGPASEFLPRVEKADTSFYLLRWVQPSEEIHESYAWLLHSREGNSGTMNGGGFASPRFDALLATAAHEREERTRTMALLEATAIVLAERPILPLYVQDDFYAFSSDLEFEPLPRQQFSTVLKRMRWKD
jgi:peptide/nickel transport system substrate-binding protein